MTALPYANGWSGTVGAEDYKRHIVWIPGPVDWSLPGAIPTPIRAGGHRTYHELAVAIAATGRRVEMRGDVDFEEVRALSEEVGVRVELPDAPHRPSRGDLVTVGEGTGLVRTYTQLALSGARLIWLQLAPSGLWGWPFVEHWALEDPTEVSIDALARPEHFRAARALGFELWTTMPRLLERIESAGVRGKWIGNGRPLPYPSPLPKAYDVVTLANNRWADLARKVVASLDPSVVRHEVPPASNEEVLRAFGQSRIL